MWMSNDKQIKNKHEWVRRVNEIIIQIVVSIAIKHRPVNAANDASKTHRIVAQKPVKFQDAIANFA